jgi:putative solute:sodium symporter small subunit
MSEPPSQSTPLDTHDPKIKASLKRYWRSNIALMSVLLACWAFVGLGCGVLWADWLNQYTLPGTGFPLGFWFAQQGSIIGFVLIILIYALAMNRLDKKHHDELTRLRNGGNNPGQGPAGHDRASRAGGTK